MSQLTDKLNQAHAELSQAEKVSKARAIVQPVRSDLRTVNAKLQVIADSGVFDTVDADIKTALINAWNIIKAAEAAFDADAAVTELLDWRPA